MHRFTAVAGLLLAAPAYAQPVVHPPCNVTIAHAPDDVRAIVEHWVAAEPRCGIALEVRIVPTDGGLYLFARDDRGRVRERVVPDAQSAGVLVASWAADDAIVEPPARIAPIAPIAPVAPVAPVEAVAPVAPVEAAPVGPVDEAVMAPGVMFVPERIIYVIAPERVERWISIDAGMNGDLGGLRASVDLWGSGSWTIGAAGSLAAQSLDHARTGSVDIRATAYLAHTNHIGNWRVRGVIGAGLDISRYDLNSASPVATFADMQPGDSFGTEISPVVQLAVTLSHELDRHWGVGVGPVLTVYPMQPDYMGTLPRQADLMVFAGLQHRL